MGRDLAAVQNTKGEAMLFATIQADTRSMCARYRQNEDRTALRAAGPPASNDYLPTAWIFSASLLATDAAGFTHCGFMHGAPETEQSETEPPEQTSPRRCFHAPLPASHSWQKRTNPLSSWQKRSSCAC